MAKLKKIAGVFWAAAFLALAFLLLILWLYTGELTAAKAGVYKALPFPMAMVNGRLIPMDGFLLRREVALKLAAQTGPLPAKSGKLLYEQIIQEERLRQLSAKYAIKITDMEVDAEYDAQAKTADTELKKDFGQLLYGYGLTPGLFKEYVIKPKVLSNNLKVWYNSNQELNRSIFEQAQDLESRIRSGEDFSILSKAFSQDEATKPTGGESGFFETPELLPELREAVETMRPGEVKVLSSRFGIHIVRITEKKDNKVRIAQIFLGTSGFEEWLKAETKNFKIKKFFDF